MAVGKTNSVIEYLNEDDIMCVYRCRVYNNTSINNIVYSYMPDYFTYSSSDHTFTVLQPFSGKVITFAQGLKNTSGTTINTYFNFYVNSTKYSSLSGSATHTGNGIPSSAVQIDFKKNDVISLTGSHGSTSSGTHGQMGFYIYYVKGE